MDLRTTYAGLTLRHPIVVGASPIVDDLDLVRRAEDAGAAAIVMHSLFEEQLVLEQLATDHYREAAAESFAEALSYLPEPALFALGPDAYLEQIRRLKAAVAIPIIGSLNGLTPRGWLKYGKLIAAAGADALELNMYQVAVDSSQDAESIESESIEMVSLLKRDIGIPLCVKLSPFYTALAHFAARLDQAGADALVLFNRFYQPDIDVERLDVDDRLELSSSSELRLRLRWLAALSGKVRCSLAATGGVHSGLDAVKAVMAGAHAVQMVSALLRHGPERIESVVSELAHFLETHEYESLRQMQGSMSLKHCPNPRAYERGNYVKLLQSYHESIPNGELRRA
jgi:dihydroorotate dehydrogenase (fumarate)